MADSSQFVARNVATAQLSAIKEMAMRSAKVEGAISLAWGLPSFSTPEHIRRAASEALASDPDVGDSLTYAITGGNTNGAFAVDSVTGVITVANSPVLDFEATPTFVLTVEVQDAGGLTDDASVTIKRLTYIFS